MTINARAATTPPCTGAEHREDQHQDGGENCGEHNRPGETADENGEATCRRLIKRSKKPFWMSVAMPVPASPALNATP